MRVRRYWSRLQTNFNDFRNASPPRALTRRSDSHVPLAPSQERQEGGAPVGRQGLRGSMAACCRADGTPASSACGLRPFAMRERRRASQPFVAPAVQPP
jgi:hypothetical protein